MGTQPVCKCVSTHLGHTTVIVGMDTVFWLIVSLAQVCIENFKFIFIYGKDSVNCIKLN